MNYPGGKNGAGPATESRHVAVTILPRRKVAGPVSTFSQDSDTRQTRSRQDSDTPQTRTMFPLI